MLWLIFGVFCILGTVQHFLFVPLGRPRSLMWLLPVSESPWEHYKLAFWPLGGALGTVALLAEVPLPAFLCAWAGAAAHGFCTMLGIYYLYRAALGVPRPVLWVDISNYYITMLCGWLIGLKILRTSPGWSAALPCGLGLLLCALFFGWAAALPPDPPMFQTDPSAKKSGPPACRR